MLHTLTVRTCTGTSLNTCIGVCIYCMWASSDRGSEARVRPDHAVLLTRPPLHAQLEVWECVIRYHTSSRTCKDREDNPAGERVWPDLISYDMQIGMTLTEQYFIGCYYILHYNAM